MRNSLIPFVVGFVLVALVILENYRIAEAVDMSLNNNFESGTLYPWIEESKSGVKWKIENTTSSFEPNNLAPVPFSGKNYLRVDRGTSLAFGVSILRSPVFKIPPGDISTFFSFSFWIRSKWPQYTSLELYLAKNGNEGLLLNLYEYSDVNNQVWRQSEMVVITDDTSSDLTLVFYAYCGTSTEDAVTIDDLYFSDETSTMTSIDEITTITSTEETSTMTSIDKITSITSTEATSIVMTDSTLMTTLAEVEKCPDFLQGDPDVPCWIIETKCYCFYIGSRQQNWTEANQFCRGGSMTLLSIETAEEDQLIFDHVSSTSEIPNLLYWSAGRYSQEGNNRWEWASNAPFQPFSYDHWAVNEPNGNEVMDELCVYVTFNADFNAGYWFDDLCDTPGFKFICELND